MSKTAIGLVLALVLMVGVTSPATAQVTVAIGPKVGANFANVTGDDVTGTDMKVGFAFGGVAAFRLHEMWSIMPEAFYSMQGAKEKDEYIVVEQVDGPPLFGDADLTTSLDYVRIPVFVKFTIPTNSNISPYLFGGPEFAFKVRCKTKVEGKTEDLAGLSETVDCDEVIPGTIKSFDFGLGFGGGVGFLVGSGMLAIDARYGLGLEDIVDVTGGADVKNSNIQIAVSYLFTLGG